MRALPQEPQYKTINDRANLPAQILSGTSVSGTITITGEDGKPMILTLDDVRQIMDGTIKLYIYGWTTYTDDFTLFGPVRRGYCGVYNPKGPPGNDFEGCGKPSYIY